MTMSTSAYTTQGGFSNASNSSNSCQQQTDRTALLRGNNPSAAATMSYGSCGPVASVVPRPTSLADVNGQSITTIEEFVLPPTPQMPPEPQPPPPSQPKKATLLSLAAKAAVSPDSSTPSAARLDDIMRKGIDIAREFDASAFTGRSNVIKLVVADNASAGSRRQSMFEWGSGVSETDVHVVIEMPPDDFQAIPEDEPADMGSHWRRRRQRNHSDSSKAPLMSDA